MVKIFQKLDTNHDGILSKEEIFEVIFKNKIFIFSSDANLNL